MEEIKNTLYIILEKSIQSDQEQIFIKDAARVECSDEGLTERIKKLPLTKIKEEERMILSVLDIIHCIENHYPNLKIENLGSTDLIITRNKRKDGRKITKFLKTLSVLGITFAGASFSMIAFNNDINSSRLFQHVQYLFTGESPKGFTFLEFSYCIGLTTGILLFFNHFKRKAKTKDPTPMEIEMRLYEKDIQTTIIENKERKKKNYVDG